MQKRLRLCGVDITKFDTNELITEKGQESRETALGQRFTVACCLSWWRPSHNGISEEENVTKSLYLLNLGIYSGGFDYVNFDFRNRCFKRS